MTLSRRVATLAALTLASAGLVGVAGQPASAAPGAELHWGISQYLNEHLSGQTFTDGATATDGVVTFVDGVVEGDSVSYTGTARYAFVSGGAEFYSYSFSDVTVTLDEGAGTISADVAWTAPTGPGAVADATLTTFSTDDDWSDGSLTATPDWLGVAPADTYGAGKPVGGASWAVDFVQALPASLQASFYASGSGNDPKKPPAAFTATAEVAAPAVTATTSYDGNAVLIDVDGTGFTAVTNPGDAGVYVALAEAGDFPETDDFEDQDKVADAEWVTPAQMADGTFSVALNPENRHLDPSTQYAVYTWQAHGHSNPTQDTETPVTIDWSKVGSASKLKVTSKPGKLVVTNGTAVGKVTVKLTKGKVTKTAKATMKKGQATVKLPKLTAGTWKAKVTFLPSTAEYRSATKSLKVEK